MPSRRVPIRNNRPVNDIRIAVELHSIRRGPGADLVDTFIQGLLRDWSASYATPVVMKSNEPLVTSRLRFASIDCDQSHRRNSGVPYLLLLQSDIRKPEHVFKEIYPLNDRDQEFRSRVSA